MIARVDSLCSHVVFAWRQIKKHKLTSAAAVAIRMPIARRVTLEAFSVLSAGSLAGLAMGLASARYLGTLLYQVSPTDPSAVAFPSLTILAMALLAAALPVVRAVGADPAALLRVE